MTTSRLLAAAALIVLVLWPAAFATADDNADDPKAPSAQTDAATAVGDRTATLSGRVRDNRSSTTFRFEYGATTSYGQSTTANTLSDANSTRTVTAAIDGLVPGTVYHFRLRASNHKGTTLGEDRSFTTTGSAATAAGTDPGVSTGPSPAHHRNPPVDRRRQAGAGGSVVVAPLAGTVEIELPGSAGYATLAAGDSVPVGTVVDTRGGTVVLDERAERRHDAVRRVSRGALPGAPGAHRQRHDRHPPAGRELRRLPAPDQARWCPRRIDRLQQAAAAAPVVARQGRSLPHPRDATASRPYAAPRG